MSDTSGKAISSLTVADKWHHKPGGCVGAFFQLFDWNRRLSKKKLFSNRLLLPDRTKQLSKKFRKEKLPMAKLLLIADENRGGFPNAKKPDPDCISSNTSNGGTKTGSRRPGVVARLMGLEFLPSPEPSNRSLQKTEFNNSIDKQRKKSELPDCGIDPCSEKEPTRVDSFSRKLVESRPQKLQKTGFFEKRPVSRFQTDSLSFRGVISKSKKKHPKLLSPVKSPGILSSKHAARLMDAASKLLEPGLQATSRAKCALPCSLSTHAALRDRVSDEETEILERESRLHGAPQKRVEINVKSAKEQTLPKICDILRETVNSGSNSEAFEQKQKQKLGGCVSEVAQDPSNKRSKTPPVMAYNQEMNNAVGAVSFCSNSNSTKTASLGNNENGMSLAIQAKVNIQKKTRDAQNRTRFLPTEQVKCSSSERVELSHHNVGALSSIPHNNLRRDKALSVKERAPIKPRLCNLQSGRDSSIGAAKDFVLLNKNLNGYSRNKTCNKVSGDSKIALKHKEPVKRNALDRKIDSSLRAKTLMRKKRVMNGDQEREIMVSSGRKEMSLSNQFLVMSHNKSEPIAKAVNSRESPDEADHDASSGSREMDIVSFTFTSPMRPACGSSTSSNMLNRKTASNAMDGDLSSPGSTAVTGDLLSALLEQKLRELASQNPNLLTNGAQGKTTVSILQDLISGLTSDGPVSQERDRNFLVDSPVNSACSSTSSQFYNTKPQREKQSLHKELEGTEFSFYDKTNPNCNCLQMNLKSGVSSTGSVLANNCNHHSPVSILDASFSNDSCHSSESFDNTPVHKLNLSPADRPDAELSDSATSVDVEKVGSEKIMSTIIDISRMHGIKPSVIGLGEHYLSLEYQELNYVREVVSNADLMFENAVLMGGSIIDPLLFDKLEAQCGFGFSKSNGGYLNRRFLFDCITETMNMKYSRCCRAGYKAWAKLPFLVLRERLTKEIYGEISRWKSMTHKVLDEIIDVEMSSPLGKWLDFEVEAFEIGVETEREIMRTLIQELAVELAGFWPKSSFNGMNSFSVT
ncbi:uncharacterized protein LOC18432163 [Amborella trichopoda]|uniref:uncharacterized protein LOC18432163 n=1 Tax=Amborella trichopoda TaxID=13333 RepID=UPI0005D3E8EC|nr:uncharacterized protein LOC18432163 [Amborella trichopoda]XP_020521617.1 uncharacterized protein LOC18432163 [Amborella trichopoda]|eukprot:XP_011622626.1 uncharacterized protein LOC18432163 [Amborella trichopoda]